MGGISSFLPMQYIYDLFKYVGSTLKKCLFGLLSIPGLILSAVGGFAALLLGLFTGWDYSTELISRIDNAANMLDQQFGVFRYTSSPMLDMLVSFLAVDTLVECMVLLVGVTVALVTVTLVTFLGLMVSLCVGILVVRGILKVISICSAGFVDP